MRNVMPGVVDVMSWLGTMISVWTPRRSLRLVYVIAILASVELISATPAVAGPPTRTEFTVPLSGPHFLSGFCGTLIEQDAARTSLQPTTATGG